MGRFFALWLSSSLLLVLVAGCSDTDSHAVSDPSEAPVKDLGTVRQAIERGYAQYIQAFGEADAAGVAGVYDERGARLYSRGLVVRGHEAVQADLEGFIERVGPVRVTIEIDEVWMMDDTAYETGRWVYTYTPEGEGEKTAKGRYLTTWRQQPDGGWKIWADVGIPGT